ncbi:MAG: hypothetical protein HC805_03920, partial [Alkalinema sp. RL_2_19]|nr:hypothetical protein [Alkalinema sp. RL_2_19]
MLVQEHKSDCAVGGPCSDCGTFVARRVECLDHVTHSTVALPHFPGVC